MSANSFFRCILRDFNQLLAERGGEIDAWRFDHSKTEYSAYIGATMEALDLPDAALLVGAHIRSRTDVLVDYLGKFNGPQGTFWYAVLFRFRDDLEVVVGIEDDATRAQVACRGSHDAFTRLAVELRLFEDLCFAHLRDDEAA